MDSKHRLDFMNLRRLAKTPKQVIAWRDFFFLYGWVVLLESVRRGGKNPFFCDYCDGPGRRCAKLPINGGNDLDLGTFTTQFEQA